MGFSFGSIAGALTAVAGLVTGNVGLATAGLGMAATSQTAAASAAASSNLNKTTRKFNHDEAELARNWSAEQSQLTRDYNSYEAQLNRDWSAQQADLSYERNLEASNTAHQREVADLRAAGLNPILSANNGASGVNAPMAVSNSASAATPTASQGSQGSQQAYNQAAAMQMLPSLLSSAAQYKNAETNAEKAKSDIKVNEQSIEESISKVKLNEETLSKVKAETGNLNKQVELVTQQIKESIGRQNLNQKEIENIDVQMRCALIISQSTASKNYLEGKAAEARSNKDYHEADLIDKRIEVLEGDIAESHRKSEWYDKKNGGSGKFTLEKGLSLLKGWF